MAQPARVPDWLRPDGLPAHRMPSAQALQRLIAGNERYRRQRAGEGIAPGDASRADFPFALVVGCIEADAASEVMFAERPGAVLCARTAGPSLGPDTLAAIEYAALVQNVGVVLVLGHADCRMVATAVRARRANVELPGALSPWAASASVGAAGADPMSGHVRALRTQLRREDSLLSLTRAGRLKIAAGVLDSTTGAIEFLPDEPEQPASDASETWIEPAAGRSGYGFGS